MLALAKPALDLGIYTDAIGPMRGFYEGELGLAFDHLLPLGGGVQQHRLDLHGSVLKLNASRDPLEDAPTCFRGVVIADAARAGTSWRDPDGLQVACVAPGERGVDAVGVEIGVADVESYGRFLVDGLGASSIGDGAFRLATTTLLVDAASAPRSGPLAARGFRYLTVQVRETLAEHARLLDLGYEEGMAPLRAGDIALISFIRDPGGGWWEISQRASLVGPLDG